jgi:peroxin-14
VGYGVYFTAKVRNSADNPCRNLFQTNASQRYIIPLIAPPTPPQLEQDKQTIDQSFEKAFALLDQLNTDTEALKAAETSRTERLDAALAELESVLSSLKEADRKREDESKRNSDEIRSLRDLIPKALEGQKDATDTRLKNLGEELKSLSKLIGNRMGGAATTAANPSPTPTQQPHRPTSSAAAANSLSSFQTNGTSSTPGGSTSPVPPSPSTNGNVLGSSQQQPQTDAAGSTAAPAEGSRSSTPSGLSSRFGSGAGKASIPAWQMAAAKKSQETASGEGKKDTSASGTAAVEATS